MHVLHYILGFPPMRSGGLTKYAIDLMLTQKKVGCQVFAIYPGNPFLFFRKRAICKEKVHGEIPCFKIRNAPLLPLLHGIKNIHPFIMGKNDDLEVFQAFFRRNHFDVLHVHTMMGMPISFLQAAKENKVKIVYTSHDYYGLCAKVNFIDQDGCFCKEIVPEKCVKCNECAKSLGFIWLRNSRLLVLLKKFLKR